jgi:O-6-methylguanine DNA methyltransferase
MLKFTSSGHHVFATEIGPVGLTYSPQGVKRVIFGYTDKEKILASLQEHEPDWPTALRPSGDVAVLVKRIKSHLKGKNDSLRDVPLDLRGVSDFSNQVLRELCKIGPGKVVTYGELASRCGKPKAARAIGRIMGANPIPLVIPCHRCMGKDGSLTGFSTEGGTGLKARLLFLEGYVRNEEHSAGVRHLKKSDKVMKAIITKVGPYQAISDKPSPAYDTLVSSIIHQQLSIKAGITIANRVRNLTPGKSLPTPEEMGNIAPEDLRKCGLSGQKVSYVKDLAGRVYDGSLKLGRLRKLDDEAVIEELTAVRGIGRWSAQMYLVFHLGRLDVLPLGDVGFQNGAIRAYGLPDDVGGEILEELAAPWQPYRSMATWYLWQYLSCAPENVAGP